MAKNRTAIFMVTNTDFVWAHLCDIYRSMAIPIDPTDNWTDSDINPWDFESCCSSSRREYGELF